MNISKETIAVLKNFSDINQNILVKPGQTVQTISTMKNILSEAEIKEKFEQEFAIYDLPEFLRSLDLFDKPVLKFNGGTNVQISEEGSKQNIKYYFSDKSVVVSPTKTINMPDKFVTFTFKKDDFAKLMRAATTLNLPDVALVGDGSTIKITATDKKNNTSNQYDIDVGSTDKTFTAYFKVENFKMIPDDYDVAISSQKISHFISKGNSIQYWIALEPDSEF